MDDWGDPWQDAHAPKRPPAIDIHILGAQASKERVVTPVLTGFFEDQAKWSEPDTHDVWASSAHDAPSPPLRPQLVADAPSWSLPGPDAAEADKHADPHGTGVSTAQPAPPASDPSQPAEEATSNPLTVDIPFHEATLPSDAPEDPGAPPATPTAPDVDSSDSGTTIGPDPAGYTALEPSTPPATRPPSGEFESGISTRPSTSPSEVSHDVYSDSPRTSLDEDIEPRKSSANIKPVECTEKEESEVVAGAETKAEAEDTTATLPSVDDITKDTTTDTPAGTAEDAVEATAQDETEDTAKLSPDDKPDDAANETHENTFDNDDDDFDDFGDFEEETDEPVVEEETADTVASPVEPEPSRTGNVLASALDLNGTPPDSPRPIIKSDFEPDLNLIGKLFPDADSKNDLPEVEDSPIKPTNARKAWYRLTRIETMREIGSGKNHDNYVRVGWRDSDVRTEVNQIVGRWASEDRINGRTLLGGKPGATFGWDYPMPSPASSVFSMNSHKRNASAATTPRKAVFDLEETKQRPVSLSLEFRA
ncbi:hypothetical protein GTA08_BOTSDO01271 [Neofusicoccum parvum]|nr:hypothetical protein GTA08_BOTSDO01271 [Neofusicoccum parvum]